MWTDIGREKGLQTRLKNKIKKEFRICKCGCNSVFECRINSKEIFLNQRHYIDFIKRTGRPQYVRDKISTYLINKYPLESRLCKCGCGKIFICKTSSLQSYASRGHATKDKNNVFVKEQRRKQSIKLKGRPPWNNGLTKEDSRVAKNVIGFQKLNKERTGKHTKIFGKTYEELYGKEKAIMLKKRFSERMRLQYASFTDEQKANYLKTTIFKAGNHPNNFEVKCKRLLDIYYPNEFEYCGQGKPIIINGKNPDFIHKNKKIVVLCHGIYWHIKKLGYEDTVENRHSIELLDSEPFRTYGYEVWVIWEDRLDLNKVIIFNKREVKQNVEEVCT